MTTDGLSAEDRFLIFEQMNLHQRYIDNDASAESAKKYVDLFWPDGRMTVHYATLQNASFDGPSELKQVYDYAHSVFPIHRMRHSVGAFLIDGAGNRATAEWHWIVRWREGAVGTASTGTYNDVFERRNGQWKCLERVSTVDANWPLDMFKEWVDREEETFRES